MELLLFLSAILTALTGAITGTRVSEPPQLAASSIAAPAGQIAQSAIRIMPAIATRPVVVLRLAAFPSLIAIIVAPIAPLYAGRRRE